MFEHFLRIITLIICWLPAMGQQLEEGPAWKQTPGYRPVLIAGPVKGDLWLVNGATDKTDGIIRDLMLECLDVQQLSPKGVLTFPGLFADRQQYYPEGVIAWNDTLRIFGSAFDKQHKRYRLLMRNLSANGNLSEGQEIFSFPASDYIYNRRRFGLEVSSKNQRLAIWGYTQNKDSLKVHYQVFDQTLQVVKRYSLSQKTLHSSKVEQTLIDDYGNFHVLFSQHLQNKQQGNSYSLYAFPVMSDEVLAYQIELPDKRISDIAIQVTEDDYLIAAGYYSDLFRSEDALSGYFFLKIDRETGEIPVKEIRQMGQEFYNLYSGQGNKPSRKDLERLKIRKILPVSGSACLLIAETEWSEERCETDVRTGQRICDTHYIFGPLILQHFSGSGSMDWLQFLRKFQHSAGDEAAYSSFLMHARPQLVTFYYNKPSEMGKGGKPARMDQDKNIVGYFRVDSGGQDEPGVSRTAGSYQAIPASALIWNGDLYFLGEKDGSRKLFKSGQQP